MRIAGRTLSSGIREVTRVRKVAGAMTTMRAVFLAAGTEIGMMTE